MSRAAEPRKAEVGREFTARVFDEDVKYVVAESCGGTAGAWYCITHDRTFRHNLEKDQHLGTASRGDGCELAWVCPEHGPEAP